MTDIEHLLFYFLRRGLWGRADTDDVNVDDGAWDKLFLLSCRHAVTPLVADGIALTSLRPPQELWQQWIAMSLRIEIINERMARCGELLVNWLADENISASVFKGTSVARWYPEPFHRGNGDIDIVVNNGWDRLERLFLRCGISFFYESGEIIVEQPEAFAPFVSVAEANKGVRNIFTLPGNEPYRIEFHYACESLYNPFADARLKRMSGHESSLYVKRSFSLSGDAPEFYLSCLVLHLRRHVLSYGIGLKQVCDVAVMLRRANLDITLLESLLRRLGAWRFSRVLFSFVEVYLYGMPVPSRRVSDKDVALLYSIFMDDGYMLKIQREDMGRRESSSAMRIVHNGWFWIRRSIRLFRLMPAEAFFFVCRKTYKRLHTVVCKTFKVIHIIH
ncbi:nucleotidyltransferase family protein [Marseilla massiliensis]|uniref:Nucleotidyltransferase family protein n=1 Tax=Marseilla massiliensis TaxID=1841864 RepID=A0A938WTF6_9BACT|nr:nucleotidyltransferase family protein [Marseilla massiliensis]MBM6674033.1 nucleotidyltransferase family protein [Marseilla massiliensis]